MFATLVEAESFAMNFEKTFGRFPVLALAAHAFAEDGGVEFAAACFANSIHHAVGFGRQFLS